MQIESIIFDGESISTVLRTTSGRISYTISRAALKNQCDMFDQAKSVVLGKLSKETGTPPKGGYHFNLTAAELASRPDATNAAA